jgi:predicted PurR-regulated permease PerM
MVSRPLPESERRWLRALLILGTVTVGMYLLGLVSNVVLYFSDILITLVLAWLLAFMVSPIVDAVTHRSSIPRTIVVVVVYALFFVLLLGVIGLLVGALATSISGFITDLPGFQERLPGILQPWQERLRGLGFQVDLQAVAQQAIASLSSFAQGLAGPLATLAFSIVGVLGNLLIVVFLSLFIVIDKDKIVAFVNRLIPPRWSEEANLFQQSVATSFGGFLRGQAIQGVVYGAIAAIASAILGIDYIPVTTAAVAILQMVPFFGPFISWAPPILVALVTNDPNLLPIFVVMWAGWFVVMNFLQPRLMERTVGIHPVGVLVSVLIGLKLAGVVGAIFAIPVAAVISTFFFYYLQRSTGGARDVTTRAAERVGRREGRRVRIPTPPSAADPVGDEVRAAEETSADGPDGVPGGEAAPDGDGPDLDSDRIAAASLVPHQT